MKILVLTSRYTATRDIIGEDFGRQTRLFSALKKFDHSIDFLCADYKKKERKNLRLNGINVFIRPFGLLYFFRFLKFFNKILKNKYDVVIGTSDPLWGAIGYYFSRKNNVKFIYDLHDNYETYSTYKLPMFGLIDQYVMEKSDKVITVSDELRKKIGEVRKNNVTVIQNGFDEKLFVKKDQKKCRKDLGLLNDSKIIGYAGSIQRVQGLHILVKAFKNLKKEIPELKLVIAGRYYGSEKKHINLKQNGVKYLGSVGQEDVVKLINASDVMVVPNTDNDFSRYCFPYKVVEYMACDKKLVATNLGDVGKLLENYPDALCDPDSVRSMVEKLRLQLNSKNNVKYRGVAMENTWHNIAKKLDGILQ